MHSPAQVILFMLVSRRKQKHLEKDGTSSPTRFIRSCVSVSLYLVFSRIISSACPDSQLILNLAYAVYPDSCTSSIPVQQFFLITTFLSFLSLYQHSTIAITETQTCNLLTSSPFVLSSLQANCLQKWPICSFHHFTSHSFLNSLC